MTSRFPDGEKFGLTSQLRRASVSVPSNIAEGSGRTSDAEFVRFLEIAYGSLMEAMCQLHLALEFAYLKRDEFEVLREEADKIARMLSGLRKHRLSKDEGASGGQGPGARGEGRGVLRGGEVRGKFEKRHPVLF